MIPAPKCPPPKIDNQTEVWNDHDKEVQKEVEGHCEKIYGEGYCVKMIRKTGENSYQVLCYSPIKVQGVE